MAIYPAAALVVLIWMWQTLRDPDRGALVIMAALPFGMFAALSLGGLSILASHLLAMLTLGIYALRRIGGDLDRITTPPAGIFLLIFALYALFSATVLVRIFAGDFLVFPMSFDRTGLRLSIWIPSSLKPLAPGNSNISQTGYILIAALVFILLADTCRRRGVSFVEQGIVWAGSLNIVLAAMDLAGLDAILSLVRTADYSLKNEHALMGMARVIGGFAEASSFGSATAVFFAWFGASFMIARRRRDGVLAALSLMFVILSFSSTGIAALMVALVLIVLHSGAFLHRGLSRAFAHVMVIGVAALILVICVAALTTPLIDTASGVIDRLFVQKSGSTSGLERGAWAAWGLVAFMETWGLGAGAGSIRSNGMGSVLLGSVGLPGTLLFIAFVWASVGPAGLAKGTPEHRVFIAARIATLTLISGKMLSTTTPDPGLTMMALTAIAAALRVQAMRQAPAVAQMPVAVRG